MWDNVNFIINKKWLFLNIDNLKVKDKDFQYLFLILNVINRYFCNVLIEFVLKLLKVDCYYLIYMKRKKLIFCFV